MLANNPFYTSPVDFERSRVIISDTKEIIKKEEKECEDSGYLVVEMNLTQEKAPQYNPFTMFRSERDIMCFADELAKQTELQKSNELQTITPIAFPDRLLLSAVMLYLYNYCATSLQNMQTASKILRTGDVYNESYPEESFLDKIFTSIENDDPDSLAVRQYKSWRILDQNMQKRSIVNCLQAISGFEGFISEKKTVEKFDFLHKKTALYVIVSPYDSISMLKAKLLLWQVKYMTAKEKTGEREDISAPEIFVAASLSEYFPENHVSPENFLARIV